MSADDAMALLSRLMWTAVITGAPVLAAMMIAGILVSILQVTTQLQEMTLSYIPKLVTAALLMILLGPWMMRQITQFAVSMLKLIPYMG